MVEFILIIKNCKALNEKKIILIFSMTQPQSRIKGIFEVNKSR